MTGGKMKKVDVSIKEIKEKIGNKYAAVLVIANRAKAIRENPADVDEEYRKMKPTVAATKEFLSDKIKHKDFEVEQINLEE